MFNKLQEAWYNNHHWVWLLAPITLLFYLISACRRLFFRLGILASSKANVAVIVVGNIGIGGNGKTPLVIALVKQLRRRGYSPAVLSRGYGGQQSEFPYLVGNNDTASLVGDEPALIFQREDVTTVIDPRRARGVQYIEQNTSANVIICDDGLQHYAMARDLELCVLDKRGIGNGFLLPMGPLREGKWRLATVNAIIQNIGFDPQKLNAKDSVSTLEANASLPPFYNMRLEPSSWVNVNTKQTLDLSEFKSVLANNELPLTAIAGIGDPKRFFDTLSAMGIQTHENIAKPDHHAFNKHDIPRSEIVLMTEKDAIKCRHFAHENTWYLRIDADIDDEFFTLIENTVKTKLAQNHKAD